MRTIKKGGGHFQLNARHTSYLADIAAGTAVTAQTAWDNFTQKAKTRDTCFAEQFGLCAYSELPLNDAMLGMHLEHVIPKSRYQQGTFDHNNIVLSSIESDKLGTLAKNDVFGGHHKRSRYSKYGFISPLKAGSRRYFHFASDGEIQPAKKLSIRDQRKAWYTIHILNLNSPVLKTRRRVWLTELELELNKLLADISAVKHFAQVELCATNGKLRQFHSAARQRFGSIGETVINTDCPSCR